MGEVLYLDLRLPLPTTGSVSINWASAGLRKTVPLTLDEGEENAVRYQWKHAIDSHGRDEPADEGTMVHRKNESGENIKVEIGVGIDPETGKMGPCEEVGKCVYCANTLWHSYSPFQPLQGRTYPSGHAVRVSRVE